MTTSTGAFRLPLSRRGGSLADAPISWLMAQALNVPGLLSLAAGFVDQQSLPAAEMGEVAHSLLSDPVKGREALQYGTTAGDGELREALLERLAGRTASTVWSDLSADDLVVTTGSQQLLYLLAELLLDEGDVVLVEDPSYFVYVGALQSFSARLVGVDCDEHGLVPAALDRRLGELHASGDLPRVKMVYLMSYFQNPTGATLSATRRGELIEVLGRWWSHGLEALLVEDAAYRELRFPGVEDLPALIESGADPERVCYVDSFSKALAPGLRSGFAAVPPSLRDPMLRLKSHHDFGSSNLVQQLVLQSLRCGLLDRHVASLGARYQEKCEVLSSVLREALGDSVEIFVPRGGLYIWLRLPAGYSTGRAGELFRRSLEERVLYVPGELCAVDRVPSDLCTRSMRLCYSYPEESVLVEAGARLARAIQSVL